MSFPFLCVYCDKESDHIKKKSLILTLVHSTTINLNYLQLRTICFYISPYFLSCDYGLLIGKLKWNYYNLAYVDIKILLKINKKQMLLNEL